MLAGWFGSQQILRFSPLDLLGSKTKSSLHFQAHRLAPQIDRVLKNSLLVRRMPALAMGGGLIGISRKNFRRDFGFFREFMESLSSEIGQMY
ncbi:MAG: hypothetical protein CBE00_03995 [Planctomycetaceae bacterium TMED240]|nr:hypothetical protein [Rhodopirellula sp.]OUX07669.1 MAG: hypothetical protein CBE00_03995 [Planctomycetaceae bacterium TMED240]